MKLHLQLPSQKQDGFSLAEVSAVFVIAGILTAVTLPSIWGMYWRSEADRAFNQVESALQQVQIQAIRRSQNCTLTLNASSVTAAPGGCLLNDVNLPAHVTIDNGGTPTLTFNFRGETNLPDDLIVTVSSSHDDRDRCITVSRLLGLMRSGVIEEDACVPN